MSEKLKAIVSLTITDGKFNIDVQFEPKSILDNITALKGPREEMIAYTVALLLIDKVDSIREYIKVTNDCLDLAFVRCNPSDE